MDILADWTRILQGLFPRLHGHQIKAAAAMSLAMSLLGRCQLSRLHLPGPSKPPSSERRWQRLLANPALRIADLCRQMGQALLRPWDQRRLWLLIDETPQANRLCCLKVSVGFRRRALPLAWFCYRPDALPARQPQLVERLLRRVHRMMPDGADVVLLADRGLAWPLLMDLCQEFGWHFLLRVQRQSHVRLPDGSNRSLADLMTAAGQQWLGPVQVFQEAGWRAANLVAVWPEDLDEPWLLVTNLPARRRRCREYGRRIWQEESFRDEKSGGLNWQASHVWMPAHAERLLWILALAMWLTIACGQQVVKRSWRRQLDRPGRWRLSIFQLGRRWLEACLHGNRAPPLTLHLYPS